LKCGCRRRRDEIQLRGTPAAVQNTAIPPELLSETNHHDPKTARERSDLILGTQHLLSRYLRRRLHRCQARNPWQEKYTITLAPLAGLPILLEARKTHVWGPQHEYFHFDDPLTKKPNENPNVVGWTREGDAEHPGSEPACLISKDVPGTKWMYVGKQHANEKWQNAKGTHTAVVNADVGLKQIDFLDGIELILRNRPQGFPEATVAAGRIAVWVPEASRKGVKRWGDGLIPLLASSISYDSAITMNDPSDA